MQKPQQKTELIAGIFVFCGLVLMGGLILKFGDFRHWFRDKYTIDLRFADAGSLLKGAPLRRGGVEIGRVEKDPTLEPGLAGVKVPMVIYQEFHINEGSKFTIKNDGLMGDSFVDVIPPVNPTGKMIEPGTLIDGSTDGDLTATASRVADKTQVVLEDIQASLKDVRTALAKLLSDENLTNVRDSLAGLNHSIATIDKKLLADKNLDELGASLVKIREAAEKLNTVADQAGTVLASADATIKTKVGPGLDEFSKSMASFRKTAESLGLVATDMRNAPGVVAGLLKDPKMREDLAAFFSNARRNGVLFYKDDYQKLKEQQANPKPPRRGLFGN